MTSPTLTKLRVSPALPRRRADEHLRHGPMNVRAVEARNGWRFAFPGLPWAGMAAFPIPGTRQPPLRRPHPNVVAISDDICAIHLCFRVVRYLQKLDGKGKAYPSGARR